MYLLLHMKTVAAFFDLPLQTDYPFDIEMYRTVYTQLGRKVAEQGGCLYVVRDQKTFLGGNTFSQAWKFDGDWFVHVPGPVTVDLIWNKGAFVSDASTNVINHPELDRIATDKWETYLLFPEEHAKSRIIRSEADWPEAVKELTALSLVVKPVDSWGGNGVVIGRREAIAEMMPPFPSILQEFADTSGGIPGIVDGMHDLRVILLGDEVGLCYIRTPPPGEMTANVSRGGKEIEVKPADIPADAMKLVRAVDAKLTRFPNRIYTIDMGLGLDGRWYVFELNTKPGFSPMETGESYKVFYGKLAAFLLKH